MARKTSAEIFDIGIGELVALAVIGLLIFGPERLPKAAADAGRCRGPAGDLTARAPRGQVARAEKSIPKTPKPL